MSLRSKFNHRCRKRGIGNGRLSRDYFTHSSMSTSTKQPRLASIVSANHAGNFVGSDLLYILGFFLDFYDSMKFTSILIYCALNRERTYRSSSLTNTRWRCWILLGELFISFYDIFLLNVPVARKRLVCRMYSLGCLFFY